MRAVGDITVAVEELAVEELAVEELVVDVEELALDAPSTFVFGLF